jgi:hypothetical protein
MFRAKPTDVDGIKDYCPFVQKQCIYEKCAIYFQFDRNFFELDDYGNKIMENGKPKSRVVADGKCSLAAMPQEVLTFREVCEKEIAKRKEESDAATP